MYVGLSLVLIYGLKDILVLHPMKDTSWRAYLPKLDSILGAKTTEIQIPSGESTMDALHVKVPGTEKLIIVSHGNAGNLGHRVPLAAILGKCGASVLLYDYRGYGESSGEANCQNLFADGLNAYDYAVDKLGYKADDIILYGESIGCTVATHIMENKPAGKVILQSPFISLTRTARDKLFFLAVLPDWIKPTPTMDNLAPLQKPHPPLLLIHGDKDSILPVGYSRELMAKALPPKALYISPGEDHNNIGTINLRPLALEISNFLRNAEEKTGKPDKTGNAPGKFLFSRAVN